jgi:hypothetical protein
MSNTQYWTLNVAGGVCALLILVCVVLTASNERLGRELAASQNQLQPLIGRAQQTQTTMQNLAVRVAQAAQSEPALLELLNRQKLKVNLNVDGQVKQVP